MRGLEAKMLKNFAPEFKRDIIFFKEWVNQFANRFFLFIEKIDLNFLNLMNKISKMFNIFLIIFLYYLQSNKSYLKKRVMRTMSILTTPIRAITIRLTTIMSPVCAETDIYKYLKQKK